MTQNLASRALLLLFKMGRGKIQRPPQAKAEFFDDSTDNLRIFARVGCYLIDE